MNPSHKKKKSKEDAPQWYIEACIDAMMFGVGVIKVRLIDGQYEIDRVPPSDFLEMADSLNQIHSQIKD